MNVVCLLTGSLGNKGIRFQRADPFVRFESLFADGRRLFRMFFSARKEMNLRY